MCTYTFLLTIWDGELGKAIAHDHLHTHFLECHKCLQCAYRIHMKSFLLSKRSRKDIFVNRCLVTLRVLSLFLFLSVPFSIFASPARQTLQPFLELEPSTLLNAHSFFCFSNEHTFFQKNICVCHNFSAFSSRMLSKRISKFSFSFFFLSNCDKFYAFEHTQDTGYICRHSAHAHTHIFQTEEYNLYLKCMRVYGLVG